MADLEDRHANAWQCDEVALNFFKHRQRHDRRTGGKIVDPMNRRHKSPDPDLIMKRARLEYQFRIGTCSDSNVVSGFGGITRRPGFSHGT
jgi:hypothetical protein